MNLSAPLKKISSGTSYGYVYIPSSARKPTILFLHGFPSGAYDWRHQISHFSQAGFGIIAPDLLGYGSTDKPEDPQEYRGKKMASEVVDILDHEGIDKVHGVGHDWGSYLLSRLANYHSDRFYSFSFLDVGYMPPGEFDIDAVEAESMAQVGFERLGFWRFFIEDDSAELLRNHFDSFHSLFYPADPAIWKQHLGPKGAMRKWLTSDSVGPLASYMTTAEKEAHRQIFRDDYGPAINWYKAYMGNMNAEDEEAGDLKVRLILPVLMITAKKDIVATAAIMEAGIRQFADDVRVKELDTGHWVQLEAKDTVNRHLEEFFYDLEKVSGEKED